MLLIITIVRRNIIREITNYLRKKAKSLLLKEKGINKLT
jgi:hypothetical protein